MSLDSALREQLNQYLALMEGDVQIGMSIADDSVSLEMKEMLSEVAAISDHIHLGETKLERTPSFSLSKRGEEGRIVFAGIPMGHEFSSFILALLQTSGRSPKVEPGTIDRIKQLSDPMNFETYVSLSCHNCPDVVQALNVMSVLNPNIKHTMVEGGTFKEEVTDKDILAVPAVYLNGEFFHGGRTSLEELLNKLGTTSAPLNRENKEPYEVLVVGGGPAGASAAVYMARKGIRTGIVADRFGGQVMDTMGIENFISVPYTEGPKLAASLEEHVRQYDVEIMSGQLASSVEKNDLIEVTLDSGAVLRSCSVILSTGARWRQLGVPGEETFKNKGVAYCPHCDGPLFEGKDVAVVGGGNSGVEAAIDLAGIVNHVTVIEFMPELKADAVLQNKLATLPNVTVITNAKVKEITGNTKVDGITYVDRATDSEHQLNLDGVFIQIGLVPNTDWLEGTAINRNRFGEIETDKRNATSIPGVYAAGDCTDSPYKQIIISMGAGANAALSAFDYLIRSETEPK